MLEGEKKLLKNDKTDSQATIRGGMGKQMEESGHITKKKINEDEMALIKSPDIECADVLTTNESLESIHSPNEECRDVGLSSDGESSSSEMLDNQSDTDEPGISEKPPDMEVIPTFELLGQDKNRSVGSKRVVHRQLPDWIINAHIVENDIQGFSRYLLQVFSIAFLYLNPLKTLKLATFPYTGNPHKPSFSASFPP